MFKYVTDKGDKETMKISQALAMRQLCPIMESFKTCQYEPKRHEQFAVLK